MTPCPTRERLAAIASDEGDDDHVATCVACRSEVAWQRELATLARTLPSPPLARARRDELAAEVMALADMPPPRRHRGLIVAGAVAAALLLVAILPRTRASEPRVQVAAVEPLALVVRTIESAPSDPAPPAAVEDDTVELRDGELAIDTRSHAPVTVVAGRTRVTLARSRATLVARDGVIVTAHVFAGTAEIIHDGQRVIVEAGETWTPSTAALSLDEFRVGYEALRANKLADAIAAFDRATDAVVAEDAQFWAAIACERAGDVDGAKRRLEAFIVRFPASPRIDDARAALDRLR